MFSIVNVVRSSVDGDGRHIVHHDERCVYNLHQPTTTTFTILQTWPFAHAVKPSDSITRPTETSRPELHREWIVFNEAADRAKTHFTHSFPRPTYTDKYVIDKKQQHE